MLLSLVAIWIAAKIGGQFAERFGQPAVLGELLGGVVVGKHMLGLVHEHEFLILLAQIGVIILLFEVGLETDLFGLLRVGPRSVTVAGLGMIVPLAGGYFVSRALGLEIPAALLIGGALSATSIAIATRTLSDLGESSSDEGRIVVGAAVLDDLLALVILGILTQLAHEGTVTISFAAIAAGKAVMFLLLAIVLGRLFAKPLLGMVDRMTVRGALVTFSLSGALALAICAQEIGSAAIIGAFAAGVVLAGTHRSRTIEQELEPIASVFTPVFFVMIGASLDLTVLNPLDPANHGALLLTGLIVAIALGGKLVSGLGAWGKGIRRGLIGASMAPRGEVVLVFAEVGRESGILGQSAFAALVVTVFVTAIVSPMLITWFARRNGACSAGGQEPGVESAHA